MYLQPPFKSWGDTALDTQKGYGRWVVCAICILRQEQLSAFVFSYDVRYGPADDVLRNF